MTIEQMEAMISAYDWTDFEKDQLGEMKLWPSALSNVLRGPPVVFKMRVGLHMNRPTQAIIANGQFIRMRPAPDYDGYDLKKLDPNTPDECVYEELVASSREKPLGWKPANRFVTWMGNMVASNRFLSALFHGPTT